MRQVLPLLLLVIFAVACSHTAPLPPQTRIDVAFVNPKGDVARVAVSYEPGDVYGRVETFRGATPRGQRWIGVSQVERFIVFAKHELAAAPEQWTESCAKCREYTATVQIGDEVVTKRFRAEHEPLVISHFRALAAPATLERNALRPRWYW